ncbi:fimbria/pilus outer membrane usher protein [Klebsiella pneumoniae]|uniref:fimbria/pilus outer membrane usher protein n=1 Tax=Klebsiella pneumoniae TaxID=573 RepID=UPI002265F392|nr:fimbria/pilus outer membrane usher protein [Klebsiella pneumoniae]
MQTGTSFSVAGYRYSTSGYYSFQDFVDNSSTQRDCCTQSGRTKGRFDASLSQTLFGYGSLSLSLVNETYWDVRVWNRWAWVIAGRLARPLLY